MWKKYTYNFAKQSLCKLRQPVGDYDQVAIHKRLYHSLCIHCHSCRFLSIVLFCARQNYCDVLFIFIKEKAARGVMILLNVLLYIFEC